MSLSAFRSSMLECEVYRNGIKITSHKGLISDSKDYNVISFEPDVDDIQVGDDIYCPIKKKHYMIVSTDIKTFHGQPHSFDAYFENNFTKPTQNLTFNTYNPNNSVIGTQQNVTLNINDCFNNLQMQIEQQSFEDKEQLYELLDVLKAETSTNQISNSAFTKFKSLFAKHAPWLVPSITQIIAAWIQRG